MAAAITAAMVKLVDTTGLGPVGGDPVEVRVLFAAPQSFPVQPFKILMRCPWPQPGHDPAPQVRLRVWQTAMNPVWAAQSRDEYR